LVQIDNSRKSQTKKEGVHISN